MELYNPKQPIMSKNAQRWYYYYAGFSFEFVDRILSKEQLGSTSIVLDPWNGSGITTIAALKNNLSVVGYDINPVAAIVAKSFLLDRSALPSIISIAKDIIKKARRKTASVAEDDLLRCWFDDSCVYIRNIDKSIQQLLIDDHKYNPIAIQRDISKVSSIACFMYVALFSTVKDILRPFKTSNPTWIKDAKRRDELISIDMAHLETSFIKKIKNQINIVQSMATDRVSHEATAEINIANAKCLPLESNSVDCIITSPPYCTRIDYAVTTKAELAVLGGTQSFFRMLRDEMMGTSTIRKNYESETEVIWRSPACKTMLERVREHPSRASEGYYHKGLVQYFSDSEIALCELNRVLKHNSLCTVVVQDSYYKDIHIDLPLIYSEIAQSLRWELTDTAAFVAERSMVDINSRAQAVRPVGVKAKESVLCFRKGG